ncbi:glycosyltransferase family 2 protein [Photorhabdus sp. APURE]|uniref:glycosyltransferase family 2 protein n=1 Tax=Photorhabdus aballayi TaxID=2991723 RepID=UPI00223E2351|nr:glycosyltransferase family 2 protein [Photorhabdus aballayi]MCW7548260.1 glycosyltransferase family 2 protein [Photorhabdus aballayi]
MLLSILIPTFNRAKELKKNLELLCRYIVGFNSLQCEIIISNNNSTDSTRTVCEAFSGYSFIKIFHQKDNIGLEKNTLFCLSKSTSQYVLFLGDDDYISQGYFNSIIRNISEHKYCAIIPSFVGYFPQENKVIYGRDVEIKSRVFKSKFLSLLNLSWRGHQMSGLVVKRAGILEKYIGSKASNIYPFIFFVTYALTKGDGLHETKYPVIVTQRPQVEKDWSYGEDGLIPDMLDNYFCFNKIGVLSNVERILLELKVFVNNEGRFVPVAIKNPKWFFVFLKKIGSSSKISLPGKLIFMLFIPVFFLSFIIKRWYRRKIEKNMIIDVDFINDK